MTPTEPTPDWTAVGRRARDITTVSKRDHDRDVFRFFILGVGMACLFAFLNAPIWFTAAWWGGLWVVHEIAWAISARWTIQRRAGSERD